MTEPTPLGNPLLETLPPATDYLTYLTILEYNLTVENLPTLLNVLQDEKLTINIGWDLVQLLLPLLPHSKACLEIVARLGNPREVLLKVTESLRGLRIDDEHDSEALVEHDEQKESTAQESVKDEPSRSYNLPLQVLQMNTLLSMLAVLHVRIQTKFPSRFLATTVQAVLAAFSGLETHRDSQVNAIIDFIRQVYPKDRSGSSLESKSSGSGENAPDPEGQRLQLSPDETELQKKLLQALLTHVLEVYVLSIPSDADVAGMGWSARVYEKINPQSMIPGRPTCQDHFKTNKTMQNTSNTVSKLVTLANDLLIPSETAQLSLTALSGPMPSTLEEVEEEPPDSSEDVPLSPTGLLFLIVDKTTTIFLEDSAEPAPKLNIFPFHAKLLKNFIGTDEAGGMGTAGTESYGIIDAILALAFISLSLNQLGEPEDDEEFFTYLQCLSLVSANTPSPDLRYRAHFITTSVLRSHPSDVVRLAFIRDTLEHCPYENLKASAVTWVKGETIEANMPAGATGEPTVFSTPVALQTLGPFLFPDLSEALGSPDVVDNWTTFKLNLSFYLATLNFYYLLLSAGPIRENLRIAALHTDNDVGGSFLGPLRQNLATFRSSLLDGVLAEQENTDSIEAAQGDLMILEDVLERVESQVANLT